MNRADGCPDCDGTEKEILMIPDVFKIEREGYVTLLNLSRVKEVISSPDGMMRVYMDGASDEDSHHLIPTDHQQPFLAAWTSYMVRTHPGSGIKVETIDSQVLELLRQACDVGWSENDRSIARGIVDFHDRITREETGGSAWVGRIVETLDNVRRRLSQRGPESAAERIQGAIGEIADLDKSTGEGPF